MAVKQKIQFVCQACQATVPKWQGQCPECESWNTLVESATSSATRSHFQILPKKPVLMKEIQREEVPVYATHISELDRVLGGGFTKGSVTLIGGEPGIGKSTVALQAAIAYCIDGNQVLYVSSEESESQIRNRADRMGQIPEGLFVFSDVHMESILRTIQDLKPDMVILDSIQVVYHCDVGSSSGSVSQVRECAAQFIEYIKQHHSMGVIIGHITKDGSMAGPKVLEHMVDTILYFEGEHEKEYRLLRAIKNRYASTYEIGIFKMEETGLVSIQNPSHLFLDDQTLTSPGSMVVSILEGSRALLVEIQALVVNASQGPARRTFNGVDSNRAHLLIATIEKTLDLKLQSRDIFLNVIGGLKISDTAIDLGIILAIISSIQNTPVRSKCGVIGEVGLTGEVRSVQNLDRRLMAFENMGFTHVILPKANQKKAFSRLKNIVPIPISTISEAFKVFSRQEGT
ncbi:MAG: DNA repair protein RadA [Candidatus Margulisbacteria bacterium]|nr:DNA repair protein RadA [Candidatus Margulisiibacteriota bacterium]